MSTFPPFPHALRLLAALASLLLPTVAMAYAVACWIGGAL